MIEEECKNGWKGQNWECFVCLNILLSSWPCYSRCNSWSSCILGPPHPTPPHPLPLHHYDVQDDDVTHAKYIKQCEHNTLFFFCGMHPWLWTSSMPMPSNLFPSLLHHAIFSVLGMGLVQGNRTKPLKLSPLLKIRYNKIHYCYPTKIFGLPKFQ